MNVIGERMDGQQKHGTKLSNYSMRSSRMSDLQRFKSKTKTEREYRVLKEARKQSGARWNEKLCRIEGDEAVWNNIITSHPKAKRFRNKSFPLFESLGELYDGQTAEGTLNFTSIAPSQVPVTQPYQGGITQPSQIPVTQHSQGGITHTHNLLPKFLSHSHMKVLSHNLFSKFLSHILIKVLPHNLFNLTSHKPIILGKKLKRALLTLLDKLWMMMMRSELWTNQPLVHH